MQAMDSAKMKLLRASARRRSFTGGALLLASVGCSAGGSGTGDDAAVSDEPPAGGGGGGGLVVPGGGFAPGPDLGGGALAPGVTDDFTGVPTCDRCEDFPAAPLFEDGLGPEVAALFQSAGAAAAPCVVEPSDGMMIPANMLRPRVRTSGSGDVHKITLHADREVNDLVVYTRKNPWLVPPEIWQGVSRNVFDEDITVTVQSATSAGGGASAPAQVRFRIAPVQAGGSMIYWGATSTTPGLDPNSPFQYSTTLLGFSVGEEAVIPTLNPGDVTETMLGDNGEVKRAEYDAPRGQARCVGCHTSTGDGAAVITVDHWPWNQAVTDISGTGGRPEYVTPFGAFLLQMPWLGVSTSSRGDWALGNRVLVTSAGPRPAAEEGATPSADQPERDMGFTLASNQSTGRDVLLWIDLQAEGVVPDMAGQNINKAVGRAMVAAKNTGWGVIARSGDPRGAVTPDWSHDGATLAYTSTDSTQDGHVGNNANEVDIYTVPYNGGAGGQATPVLGASEPGVAEYYPDFSADDRFIAFNRVENGRGRIYYHPQGEIYVVPTQGGTPIRLAANDPPSCTNERSPGVTNSWPKWSPTVRQGPAGTPHEGKRYYFLLFSSTRQSPFQLSGSGGNAPASQLYLATLVESPDGSVQTYPAMYLWNQGFLITNPDPDNPVVQPIQTSNLTPAFDEFIIPPRPPVVVR